MGLVQLHRNNRVKEYLEIGTAIERRINRYRGSQMPACRRPHDTHIIRINPPCRRILPYHAYGLLRVADRYFRMAERQTILQHGVCDTHPIEIRRPIVTFMPKGYERIPSSGTSQNDTPRSLRRIRKENTNLWRINAILLLFRPAILTVRVRQAPLPKLHVKPGLCMQNRPSASHNPQETKNSKPLFHVYIL